MADQSYGDEIVKLSLSNLSKQCVNIFLGRERLRLLKLAREAFNADSFDIWCLIDTDTSAAAWASALYVLSDKPNIQSVYGKHTAKVHRGRIAEASLHVLLRDEPDMPSFGLIAVRDRQTLKQQPSGLPLEQRRRLERHLAQWEQKDATSINRTTEEQHSDDFRSLRWDGELYTFTANQAPVIRLLYDHYQRGVPDVGDETLLAAVDPESPPARLATLFRGHVAWTRIVVPGKTKGTHRLLEKKYRRA